MATAQTITLSGDVTTSGTFDGSSNLTLTAALKNSGATAGAYGPGANATPAFNATFSVPQITVDAKGRVTAAATRTVKIPANPVMTKATASAAGKTGLVPAPAAGAQGKCLRGDGTWGNPQYADSADNAYRLSNIKFAEPNNRYFTVPSGGTYVAVGSYTSHTVGVWGPKAGGTQIDAGNAIMAVLFIPV